MKRETKVMVISETVAQSIARDLGTFAAFAGLIGVGWLIDSSAMQWFGGVLAMIVMSVKAMAIGNKRTFTVAEARAELDRIEAGQ